MKMEKLSVNRGCLIAGTLLAVFSAAITLMLWFLTKNILAVWCGLFYMAVVILCAVFFLLFIRRKLVFFSNALCSSLDAMMLSAMEPPQYTEDENLFSKIQYRVYRLYEVLQENRNHIAKERSDLQELISDISHQVKTPIANLKMLDATLLEQSVPPEKQREFLLSMNSQIDKLDFLMQSMIKTSRLETGMISLEPKVQAVYATLASALGGILLNAEKKQIEVTVNCPETLTAAHDRRWTGEALFNLLDNAVKYTPEGGSIHVSVESWEMYLKISITDTGKGIPENRQGAIFKRFYREEEVHEIEGIGIGLYLAREIISMQGGYIKVASTAGKGSTFSVFLPHK